MSTRPPSRPVDAYDLVIFDLDGVIYLMDHPIPGAAEAVTRLHDEGTLVAYATNNASRRSTDVAALLTGMGVPAHPDEILTSAAAAAAVLAEQLAPDDRVLVVGADALRAEVHDAGLTPVAHADEAPVAVVQGYGPQVAWSHLAEAAVAIRGGARWIATNTDRTLPSPRGPLPGNGALVAALRTTLGRGPDTVVGKPAPALFTTAAHRTGAARPLVVGDRLDTDIEGAIHAGIDSMLVLTGVSDPRDLLAAPPTRRPTYVAADLHGLFDVDAAVALPDQGLAPGGAAEGGWELTLDGEAARLTGRGRTLDALWLLCAAAWSGRPLDAITAASDAARDALRVLGLTIAPG